MSEMRFDLIQSQLPNEFNGTILKKMLFLYRFPRGFRISCSRRRNEIERLRFTVKAISRPGKN